MRVTQQGDSFLPTSGLNTLSYNQNMVCPQQWTLTTWIEWATYSRWQLSIYSRTSEAFLRQKIDYTTIPSTHIKGTHPWHWSFHLITCDLGEYLYLGGMEYLHSNLGINIFLLVHQECGFQVNFSIVLAWLTLTPNRFFCPPNHIALSIPLPLLYHVFSFPCHFFRTLKNLYSFL